MPVSTSPYPELATWRLGPELLSHQGGSRPRLCSCPPPFWERSVLSAKGMANVGVATAAQGSLGSQCRKGAPSQGGGPHPSCSNALYSADPAAPAPPVLGGSATGLSRWGRVLGTPIVAKKPYLTDRTWCCRLESPIQVSLNRKARLHKGSELTYKTWAGKWLS